ncbi:MATE family efflux transporter [Alkaliphilus hydrothermalis]|uniref:Probable multidrug resistance protein NorM n=1 Tax=Alkaliphilus hydrothermalis TaxID=1482730 RepID=A0ABS2NS84_9FIRM|nr:MATE family efflux transporter [Alkaliphilus hydrothermalis]MBM7615632.1 putative MATE family efflux protein [Alkaliphilus hydrothermalis]
MIKNNLTEGNISKVLLKLALPIMGTSFVQMAYNLTDMFWVGKLGSLAVAAVGTGGFFMWLSMAFIFISKIGAEVGVAQSVGRDDVTGIRSTVKSALQINVILALVYGGILMLFKRPLIQFFDIKEVEVVDQAVAYLAIVGGGMIFSFSNQVFTAILNGYGNSRTPFVINVIGLLINMVLDPLLILGGGPFPALGVKGAAIATVIAQMIGTCIFVYNMRKDPVLFSGLDFFKFTESKRIKQIIRLGTPVALQSGLFTIFAMFIARVIAGYGATPVAVQRIGSQIESISWMTAGGFSTAISAFVGQNYGAGKWDRIKRGYFTALYLVGGIGIFATCLLYFGGGTIFSAFLEEEEAVRLGIDYLKILAYSQIFMCIEITTAGAFNGLGKTVPPSIVGIILNFLRIPTAMFLTTVDSLGLNGVWWSISSTSILKGIILTSWFIIVLGVNLQPKEEKLIVKTQN